MDKKGFIGKKTIILAVLCVGLGFYLSYLLLISPKSGTVLEKVPVAVSQLQDIKDIFKKLITKDALVNGIKQKKEMITTEIEMTEAVTWDDSWNGIDMFKKYQNIHFSGTGLYVVDLSMIKAESISIEQGSRAIKIKIPNPYVKGVLIDEQNTKYEAVEKGFLRFGDIKLLPQEYQVMVQEAKRKMYEKMNEPKYREEALNNTKSALKEIVQAVLDKENAGKYDIVIEF